MTPFQSPLGLRIPSSEQVGSVKQTEEERKFATADEKLILGMFKHTEEEGKCDFVLPLDVDQLENSVANDRQESRKRKNPFEGLDFYSDVFEHAVFKINYLVLALLFVILMGKLKLLFREIIQLKCCCLLLYRLINDCK